MAKWSWYVYIIECLDNTYYTGLTWSIPARFKQHLSGLGSRYTGEHGVKRLVYAEKHEDIAVARSREIQIKNWNRSKKEMLINGKWHGSW